MSHAEKTYSSEIKQSSLLRVLISEWPLSLLAWSTACQAVHFRSLHCSFLIAAQHRAAAGPALQSPRAAPSGTGWPQGTIWERARAQRASWPCGWTDAGTPGSSPAVLPAGKWALAVREGHGAWVLQSDGCNNFFPFSWSWGCVTNLYWEPCGEGHWCFLSVSTDGFFTPHLETSFKHLVK